MTHNGISDAHEHSEDPTSWQGMLQTLTESLPELVSDFMWQFHARELYASFDVPQEDLVQTAADSLTLQLRRLKGEPDAPGSMERMRRLAARRIRQGVTLESFLQANSLDFRVLWHRLETIAGDEGHAVIAANVLRVLDSVERYSNELRIAYLAEEDNIDRGRSQMRHRAIQRLFSGESLMGSDIELIADRINVRPDARFEVVAVIGDAIGALSARYGSDARVIRYETARALILLREQSEEDPWLTNLPVRGGYIGGLDGLAKVPEAAASALVIARHVPRGHARLSTEEDVWASVAFRHLDQALPRYARAVRVALESESDHDRELIVEAVTEFLRTGSVKETAEHLFCHRNTVIKRLRYFAQVTGFDPTVPREAAWIHVALAALEPSRVHLHTTL